MKKRTRLEVYTIREGPFSEVVLITTVMISMVYTFMVVEMFLKVQNHEVYGGLG